ncbi:hypothetical protein PPERSA_12703 [Pseudocohnilembus persalinus]|uniref:MORN motif n=1 Tax=Pseudocohnilembus persalinus TaxID=266149 RepID=A0A0V0QUJ0_PSEPJ|nr:hypothetical protein PPERSA_12703 [Pseudocohnilembus persalinus]|eukprot:KRX05525.1 hypothetical protein PPERSA_12703 [Pseudocohnilembus persalinus]
MQIKQEINSVQQKRPRKPVQSPESLHRKYKSELEKDLIYDQNGNLKKGMQEKKYIDGSIYIGQMSKDQREGIGIYYYQSGEVYAGEWRGNLLYGYNIICIC